MKVTFLGQGFGSSPENAIGNLLISFLSQRDFHSFTGISAFASEAGVFGLAEYIQNAKKYFTNLTIIVGVDQDGTSKEALNEILNLEINGYIFYQTETPIFHPKIYLFEGDQQVKIIIGSSNLTGRGLFVNVESSLLIEFEGDDQEGIVLLKDLKSYYKSLFEFSDPNLFKIDSITISDFTSKNIIPNESDRISIYTKKEKVQNEFELESGYQGIKIPKRGVSRIPSSFDRKAKHQAKPGEIELVGKLTPTFSAVKVSPNTPKPIKTSESNVKLLVWEKLKLSQSDAQIVPSGTAVTGNLKLSQAGYKIRDKIINQTTYFRNSVFSDIEWVKPKHNSATYEEAFCQFGVFINGKEIGVYTLKLSHDPVRIAGQGNTPTWLHWGSPLMPVLQNNSVVGKTLKLFKTGTTFLIEIC